MTPFRIYSRVVSALWLVIVPAVALAQDAQNQFVPADSIPKQEIPPAPLLYGAYAFVWAAVIVYVLFLWRRIGRVERELHEVNRKLSTR